MSNRARDNISFAEEAANNVRSARITDTPSKFDRVPVLLTWVFKYEAPSLGPDLRGCLGGLRYNEDVRSPNVSVQLCIGWNDNQGSQIPELTTLARFNQGLRYQSNCQSVDITIIGIRSWVISFNCYHANTKQQSRSLTINRTIAVPYLGRYRGSSIGRTYCRSFTRVWMMQMSSARRNASFALELPNIHLGNQGCRVTANS